MEDELDQFKKEIDLRSYAESCGYVIDWRRTSEKSHSWAMKGQNGDKIVVSRDADSQDYIYFSIGNFADSGTILDFVKNRDGLNLGEVRKKLRGWLGLPPAKREKTKLPPLAASSKDTRLASIEYEKASFVVASNYLKSRGLGAELTQSPRFFYRFKVDRMGNVLFPHYNRGGLCGFEKKNFKFTGFAKGAAKGLWASVCYKDDKILVITESAIDALSYQALHPELTRARYVSIGGSMNPDQIELLKLAMAKPNIEEVRLALDNDKGGEKMADQVREIAPPNVRLSRARSKSKDWNQDLKNKLKIG